MGVIDFIILLFIVLIIGGVFSYGFNTKGPWGSIWVFMLILLMTGWAGMLWITPMGPVYGGYAWVPIVFFIIFIGLLIAAATPSAHNAAFRPREKASEKEERSAAMFGVFFWILIILLLIAILTGIFI
jgi:small-conductance mechanosensitive channel